MNKEKLFPALDSLKKIRIIIVRIGLSMSVSEGATILAAIFNNLLGILSNSVVFFSSTFSSG